MKKFIFEFQKIRLRSKSIYWALNLSIAWLEGFFFSLFVTSDYEKTVIIVSATITTVALFLLFGGYENEKKRFETKYADLLKND